MILTGADFLAWAGVKQPTPDDSAWADLAAAAITAAIHDELDIVDAAALDTAPEIQAAARLAASELYQRRSAPFGSTGYVEPNTGTIVRLARDYIDAIRPILWRYRNVAGLIA